MKTYLNREIKQEVNFPANGTFMAYYSATAWCDKNGYSYGSMCGSEPIALWKGDYSISKWRNLSQKEKNTCDGVIIGEFREGDVSILIF